MPIDVNLRIMSNHKCSLIPFNGCILCIEWNNLDICLLFRVYSESIYNGNHD
jgi:hypothetical protein